MIAQVKELITTTAHADFDVLVVGGGAAGLRAAYEAALAGAKTGLVLKGSIGKSGASAFGVAELAGFSVPDGAADPLDSPDILYDDIMRNAAGCADPRLVRILVSEAVAAANDLERFGVPFINDPKTGKTLVAMGDFASRPRNRKIFHHGKPITDSLGEKIKKIGVTVFDHTSVLGLLRSDKGVGGVFALGDRGQPLTLRAGATILATGGAGQMFNLSLQPTDITGDGYALGYRAGAPLVNMEYMQAGFGTVHPAMTMVMTWIWALQPRFTDATGRSVLEGLLPDGVSEADAMKGKVRHYPFSSTDHSKWLEIGAMTALAQGRATEHGGLLLDLRHINESLLPKGSDLAAMWPISKEWFRKKGLNLEESPLELGVFGHAINGGLVISTHCETTIPGLYAVGETAGGPYGADRLGGNMFLNTQVFGRRAGVHAAETAKTHGIKEKCALPGELEILGNASGKDDIATAVRRIRTATTNGVLIVRTEKSLQKAESELAALREEILDGRYGVNSTSQLLKLNETLNMLDVGRMMISAALLRKETRGSHYREDFPEENADLSKPIVVVQGEGSPVAAFSDYREYHS